MKKMKCKVKKRRCAMNSENKSALSNVYLYCSRFTFVHGEDDDERLTYCREQQGSNIQAAPGKPEKCTWGGEWEVMWRCMSMKWAWPGGQEKVVIEVVIRWCKWSAQILPQIRTRRTGTGTRANAKAVDRCVEEGSKSWRAVGYETPILLKNKLPMPQHPLSLKRLYFEFF